MAYRDYVDPYLSGRNNLKRQLANVLEEIAQLRGIPPCKANTPKKTPFIAQAEGVKNVPTASKHCEFLERALKEAKDVLDVLRAPPAPEFETKERSKTSRRGRFKKWLKKCPASWSTAILCLLSLSLIGFLSMSAFATIGTTYGWQEMISVCKLVAFIFASVFMVSLPALLIVVTH